jgi:arginyl-tRNA synthetase
MTVSVVDALAQLLRQAVGDDTLAKDVRWEVPRDATFGELSSAIAFKLAGKLRKPPPVVAEQLATQLDASCRASELAGMVDRFTAVRGFVNATLSQAAMTQVLAQIRAQGGEYGATKVGAGKRVLVEFVSANPTGPLSVAHGRQAAVGDAMARVLRSQGYGVTAEYYLNDEGRQIEMLGHSLRARYLEQIGQPVTFPEDGYHGAYVTESAGNLKQEKGAQFAHEPLETFMALGMDEQLARIKDDLSRFNLTFDNWESQRALRESGRLDRALQELRQRGMLFEQDGAEWFASTRFGDDKDRVVRKQTGELTYLAPDIAYHALKYERGYDLIVNLWGPDHHGYIARIKASVQALGLPPERLVVRIVQLVTLSRQGKPVPMSKRQGEFVTFREIMDEVGIDATRWFYLMRTMESHLDFDLDLAKAQSAENPVYYVQYAHARICSILAKAGESGVVLEHMTPEDLARLVEPEERLLLRQMFQFPMALAACAQALEPHGVTVYLQKSAELFHVFYTKHRVITEDVPLSRARAALIDGVRQVLANGLRLLGISAPTRM